MENAEQSNTSSARWQLGEWLIDPATGDLSGPTGTSRLEPKLLDLLRMLVDADGAMVAHERLLAELWPGMIVGDDTLARSISRLRRALGDEARAPRYIETLSKRGYRLIASVQHIEPATDSALTSESPSVSVTQSAARQPVFVALAGLALLCVGLIALAFGLAPRPSDSAVDQGSAETALLARADDHYAQYQFQDNEAALLLYERVLTLRPDHPPALAGLANALVQKAMRWPNGADPSSEFHRLSDALASGHLSTPANARLVSRARNLAQRALDQSPDSVLALRAYGLAASAQSDFDAALDVYRKALALDPDAWGVLINLADVLEITGKPDQALPYFEQAYGAMERAYSRESARVRPWDAALGVLIAQRYQQRGQLTEAEAWYRRVLRIAPLDANATRALATLMRQQGDTLAAEQLCDTLAARSAARCE